jgi:hypothetical protein
MTLRELPELSKMYVMRLLFLDQPLSQTVVDSWSNPMAIRFPHPLPPPLHKKFILHYSIVLKLFRLNNYYVTLMELAGLAVWE